LIIINIIIIKDISKAVSQQLNRNVLSLALKTSSEISGDRSSVGKLFQTTGPLTAKLLFPIAQSSYEERWVGQTWRIAVGTDQGRMMLVRGVMPGIVEPIFRWNDDGADIRS